MQNITFDNEICMHRSCLEGFAMKFTKDLEDANDLVQDTVIKAIRYRHLYKSGTNLKGWLYTIMRNIFINNYRSQSRRGQIMKTTEEFTAAQLSKSATNNQAENKFLMKDIELALATLPSNYAVPFLRYFEGFKYHEIAEELNIPIGTVKTRIHMARKELQKSLKMYAGSFELGLKTA